MNRFSFPLVALVSLTAPVALAAAPPPIINGESVATDLFPASGALLIDTSYIDEAGETQQIRQVFCTATLIAPDVLLTAAHCIDLEAIGGGVELIEPTLYFSRQADLTAWNGSSVPEALPSDAVGAWDLAVHEGFENRFYAGLYAHFDIGLLFLDQAITDVAPATLITAEEADQVVTGATIDIVGWGRQGQDLDAASTTKQWGKSVIGEVSAPEFQVGPQVDDVRKCHGDSGGPTFLNVVTESGTAVRQVGVTSHAYDAYDCERTGGVDTRVDAHLDWIDAQMTARCDDGTREWCEVAGILPPPEAAQAELDNEDDAVAEAASTTEASVDSACGCNAGAGSAGLVAAGLSGLLLALRRR